MKKRKLYLAYGSNMNSRDMKKRCPDAKLLDALYLNDYQLEFRFYANIVPASGKQVPVVVWSITETDERILDEYEEVDAGVYRKETIRMELNGQAEVLVYVMNKVLNPIQPPERPYYRVIEEAYMEHQFDGSFLFQALKQAES